MNVKAFNVIVLATNVYEFPVNSQIRDKAATTRAEKSSGPNPTMGLSIGGRTKSQLTPEYKRALVLFHLKVRNQSCDD